MKSRRTSDPVPLMNLRGAFLRRTDFSGAILRNAELSGTDFSRADLRGADLRGARMTGTVLHGADLTSATNLTIDQLAVAMIDNETLLPDYIDRSALLRRRDASQSSAAAAL